MNLQLFILSNNKTTRSKIKVILLSEISNCGVFIIAIKILVLLYKMQFPQQKKKYNLEIMRDSINSFWAFRWDKWDETSFLFIMKKNKNDGLGF